MVFQDGNVAPYTQEQLESVLIKFSDSLSALDKIPSKNSEIMMDMARELSKLVGVQISSVAIWNNFNKGKEVTKKYVKFSRNVPENDKFNESEPSKTVELSLKDDDLKSKFHTERQMIGRRLRNYPTKDWTDGIHELVESALKTPCAFAYQFEGGETFCYGNCSECRAVVKVMVLAEKLHPEPNVRVTLTGFKKVPHKKKRNLTEKLKSDLMTSRKTPYVFLAGLRQDANSFDRTYQFLINKNYVM